MDETGRIKTAEEHIADWKQYSAEKSEKTRLEREIEDIKWLLKEYGVQIGGGESERENIQKNKEEKKMGNLLQFYEDETFGYKGIDDCENENLLEQVDHGKVLFEQSEDEDREAFFNRVGRHPANNEYCSNEELDTDVNDEDWYIRCTAAEQGYGLDKLVNSKDDEVRYEVARQGYGLDRLVNDKSSNVRQAVARHSYGLDRLISDEDWYVRAAVAEQGYGLDRLINDEHWYVRAAVAKKAGDTHKNDLLEKLINDENYTVRVTVAEQGYGLEKLINDEHWYVRKAVAARRAEEPGLCGV